MEVSTIHYVAWRASLVGYITTNTPVSIRKNLSKNKAAFPVSVEIRFFR